MKKYFIITYGCQMNHSDSERIATVLERTGYLQASKIEEADLIVVNMCSIRQSAVDRLYGKINYFSKLSARGGKIIATGCILKKDKEKLKKKFGSILDIKDFKNGLNVKPKQKSAFSALVPIASGCNNFCSYCAVPYTRGREKSRDYKEIIKEIKNAVAGGAKEIWLLGQNVNSYKSKNINFAKLLRMVNKIPGNFWIRFTSPHPKDFSDEIIKAMAECEKMTEYLNFPVQSGDDKILKKMNRPYTVKQYKDLVKKIREKIPDIALSTDVIVGFPGETKKQFNNTAKLFKEVCFDMAYISQYSPRPGTPAAKLKNDISLEEKGRRDRVLTEILKKTAFENNKKYEGREVEVLVEKEKDGFLFGKTRAYKTVKLQWKPAYAHTGFGEARKKIGEFVKAKIAETLIWGLNGELLPKLIVIVGQTASGKSKMAVELAKKLNGEIISADSRQIYKEMNIGTAKISKKEMKGVPHHLLNIVSPDENFTVAQYEKLAVDKIREIYNNGKIPILVGGTGFYIQSIVDGITIPKVAPDCKLREKYNKKSVDELFEILKKIDPQRAETIERKNPQRLIRAIEIVLKTKKPVPLLKKNKRFDCLIIGTEAPKNCLKKRISERVDAMIRRGLKKEADGLADKYGFEIPSMRTIGYQEWSSCVKTTEDKQKVRDIIKSHTLQYAKRQMTWFKRDKRINWVKNEKEAFASAKKFLATG